MVYMRWLYWTAFWVALLLGLGSYIFLWLAWLHFMHAWLGSLGVILGIIFTPVAVIYPFINWIVSHVFPVGLFVAWGLMVILGWVMMGFSHLLGRSFAN